MKIIYSILFLLGLFITSKTQAQTSQSNQEAVFKKQLLAFSPISVMERGYAVGLTYERTIHHTGGIRFSLPLFYTFNNFNDNSAGFYTISNGNFTKSNYTNNPRTYISAYPGLKIYPTNAKSSVQYGIGPSFAFTYGKTTEEVYTYDVNNNVQTDRYDINRVSMGVMVNNALYLNATPRLCIGIEAGIGVSYINKLNGQMTAQRP